MRFERRSFTLAVALCLVATVLGAPAVSAHGRPACLVSNVRTGVGSTSLQEAVNAAASGDTLIVKGTCVGSTTIGRSLTLKGVSNPAFGPATLDGGGTGRVLEADYADPPATGGSLTIDGLTITHGNAGADAAGGGGLRLLGGKFVIRDSLVTANAAPGFFGGGIEFFLGSLTLVDTTVSGNTASLPIPTATAGGGIFSAGALTLIGSTVSGNSADVGGGIETDGSLSLLDSTVSGNSAGAGAGIDNSQSGVASLTSSVVSGNTATSIGGGILNEGGDPPLTPLSSLTISDSEIVDNTSGLYGGGGISNSASLTFTAPASTIGGNTAATAPGGLNNYATTTGGCPTSLGGLVVYSPANTPTDYLGISCTW